MEPISLHQLWTVAAVLGGFQVAALSWRIHREIKMEAEGERTWLTLADLFAASSFLVLAGGVFAAPIFGVATTDVTRLFGLAVTLFTPSVFILAGHYNLYCGWGVTYCPDGSKAPRDHVTKQELVAVIVAVAIVVVYLTLWICQAI